MTDRIYTSWCSWGEPKVSAEEPPAQPLSWPGSVPNRYVVRVFPGLDAGFSQDPAGAKRIADAYEAAKVLDPEGAEIYRTAGWPKGDLIP